MSRFGTTWTIVRYSLDTMRRHPWLLVFPVSSLVAFTLVAVLLMAPVFFDVTALQVWQAAWGREEARKALIAAFNAFADPDRPPRDVMTVGFIAYHLITAFVMTFVNVAFYGQIIEAMNGGRVMVLKGFGQAGTRLAAIMAWSVVAGTVSILISAAQESSVYFEVIMGLAGLCWTAISFFVIPVMLNEPRSRTPFEYVKISMALLKRVWVEGIIAVGGTVVLAVVLLIATTIINVAILSTFGSNALPAALLTAIMFYAIFMLLYLAWQVFECGLYVYATQGVAPGTFDPDTFERSWLVKDPAQGPTVGADPGFARQMRWSRGWLALPAVVLGVPVVWLAWSSFNEEPVPPEIPVIGYVRIDLAALDYRLSFEDIQAAGLFPGRSCEKCDFSPTGTWVSLGFKVHPELRTWLARQRTHLYLRVRGGDAAGGEQLISHTLEALRARFPGHDEAIIRVDTITYLPRTTVASWAAVPGAASYTIEVDCFHCCGDNRWCTDIGSKWKIERDLKFTTFTFDWVGAQPGRWRVWSVDAKGKASPKSGWTDFDYSM